MATNNIKLASFKGRGHHHRFPLTDGKGPVIIYRLAGAGGWIYWFLGEQKGGTLVTENPKGEISENFGRIQRGTTQICLENEDVRGRRGIAKVVKSY